MVRGSPPETLPPPACSLPSLLSLALFNFSGFFRSGLEAGRACNWLLSILSSPDKGQKAGLKGKRKAKRTTGRNEGINEGLKELRTKRRTERVTKYWRTKGKTEQLRTT